MGDVGLIFRGGVFGGRELGNFNIRDFETLL